MRTIDRSQPDFQQTLGALSRRSASVPEQIEATARQIIAEVRAGGDAAVRALTARLESRTLTDLELPRARWRALAAQTAPAVRAALEHAARRIRAFHERERYESFEIAEGGMRVGLRVSPLSRVGLYVPGGTALYPSTVLMTAVPAKVAGVGTIIMTTPGPSPETLAAAEIVGVDRVFVVGGAQAVAAMAYGTESIPRVDKIVGPGNAYVAAAKRLVFGDVGIDSVAGPTEVVIAADDSVDPAWIAADLLAQAEHDVLAVPILIAVGAAVGTRVAVEVERQLAVLPRKNIAEKSLRDFGVIIVVADAAEAAAVMNLLAPEHGMLALRDARRVGEGITTAGALFLGAQTPESVGDYIAGPSHVLPTGGSARFASPLGVSDFVKRTSIIEYDAAALRAQGPDIERMAEVEGLHGHGRAVSIRTRTA
ncbi:MAG TPA: histidinol dehydrogenase [Polyangia bacterium]|jgi:histidinol dehydrogenase|nr:histidinol dehydrogenase [Polyangia bacterium]